MYFETCIVDRNVSSSLLVLTIVSLCTGVGCILRHSRLKSVSVEVYMVYTHNRLISYCAPVHWSLVYSETVD